MNKRSETTTTVSKPQKSAPTEKRNETSAQRLAAPRSSIVSRLKSVVSAVAELLGAGDRRGGLATLAVLACGAVLLPVVLIIVLIFANGSIGSAVLGLMLGLSVDLLAVVLLHERNRSAPGEVRLQAIPRRRHGHRCLHRPRRRRGSDDQPGLHQCRLRHRREAELTGAVRSPAAGRSALVHALVRSNIARRHALLRSPAPLSTSLTVLILNPSASSSCSWRACS